MKSLISGTDAYRIVKNEAKEGALSHAYLIIFPDDKNLRTALKEFAKVILSANERICSLIDKESFSDCRIYPEEGKRLAASDADNIISECGIKPVEGREKLFILDKFHDANASVQNKLLKVLEEPPEGVKFLLGATSGYSVLPTVKSRVRKLEIPPFSEGEIANYLLRNYPRIKGAEGYAAASGGIAGEAEKLFGGGYDEVLEYALCFAEVKEKDFPVLGIKISALKQKVEFFSLLRLVLRDALMYNLNREDCALLKNNANRIKNISKNHTAASLTAALEIIASAERDLKFNANFAMLVENVFININKEKAKCRI